MLPPSPSSSLAGARIRPAPARADLDAAVQEAGGWPAAGRRRKPAMKSRRRRAKRVVQRADTGRRSGTGSTRTRRRSVGSGDPPHVAGLLEAVDHPGRRAGRQASQLRQPAHGQAALLIQDVQAFDVAAGQPETIRDGLAEEGGLGAALRDARRTASISSSLGTTA